MRLNARRATACLGIPVVAAALVLAVAPAAVGDWREPVPGISPINQIGSRSATNSDLTTVDGVPYVVWNEDTTQGGGRSSTIRVARLAADGQTWEKVGNAGTHPISYLGSTSSESPSIVEVDGVPWVAWQEGLTRSNSEIRVARLDDDGAGWERVPDVLRPVNHLREDPGGMGMEPMLISDGGDRPYVTFFEVDPGEGSLFFEGGAPAKVWVMRLSEDGTTWEEVGGGHVNPLDDYDAAFPRITLVDGTPWVVYFQVEIVDGSPSLGVRASRLSAGGTWEQVGPVVVAGGPHDVGEPDIATVDGVPHLAVPVKGDGPPAAQVFALDEAGTGWDSLGQASPDGVQTEDVSIEEIDGRAWVAWRQRSGESEVGVAVLRDSGWERLGTPYSGAGEARHGPSLADVNGFPWFSFTDHDGQSQGGDGVAPCCGQVRVARLEPDFGAASSQATDDSATLLSWVEDYGLPFPVGFDYGVGGSLDHTSLLAPREDQPLLFRVVSELLASTLYAFRPVATAGTPQPKAHGATGYFVTDPAGGVDDAPVVAITRVRDQVPQGGRQRVKLFTTDPGSIKLMIVGPQGEIVAVKERAVEAGVVAFRWRARVGDTAAPVGRYVARVRLVASSGEKAGDRAAFRVVRR